MELEDIQDAIDNRTPVIIDRSYLFSKKTTFIKSINGNPDFVMVEGSDDSYEIYRIKAVEIKVIQKKKPKPPGYFKRLKSHPGLGIATLMTILCFLAAGTNKSIHSLEGVLILGSIGSAVIWSIVLLSNFGRK